MSTITHGMLLFYQEYSIIHLLSRMSKCYPTIRVRCYPYSFSQAKKLRFRELSKLYKVPQPELGFHINIWLQRP